MHINCNYALNTFYAITQGDIISIQLYTNRKWFLHIKVYAAYITFNYVVPSLSSFFLPIFRINLVCLAHIMNLTWFIMHNTLKHNHYIYFECVLHSLNLVRDGLNNRQTLIGIKLLSLLKNKLKHKILFVLLNTNQ